MELEPYLQLVGAHLAKGFVKTSKNLNDEPNLYVENSWKSPFPFGCFQEYGKNPQIIHFNRVFPYKPSILGYHYFWKHPFISNGLVFRVPGSTLTLRKVGEGGMVMEKKNVLGCPAGIGCIWMISPLYRWFSPQIIPFNRVFHYFHHPFWGTSIFGNTPIQDRYR